MNTYQTRVAVLIPVYNGQNDLNQTLASLGVIQTSFDIVIVDDGSEPEVRVPQCAGIHTVIILRNQNNVGIERSLNKGLEYIIQRDYEFVARLDAGDICLPQRFELQLQYMDEHPEVMLIGSQVEHFDEQGRIVFIEHVPTALTEIRRKMHLNSCFAHPAVMMRTTAFKTIGVYGTAYPAAEDYELFFRFIQHFPASNLNQVLTRKEINPNSISLRKRKLQLRSRLHIQLRYFDFKVIESYIGLFKTMVLYMIPNDWIIRLKHYLSDYKKMKAQGTS